MRVSGACLRRVRCGIFRQRERACDAREVAELGGNHVLVELRQRVCSNVMVVRSIRWRSSSYSQTARSNSFDDG